MSRELITQLRTIAPGRPIVLMTGGCLRTQRFTSPTEMFVRHRAADIMAIVDEQADSMGSQPVLSDLATWSWAPPIPIVASLADLDHIPASVIFGLDLPPGTPLLARHGEELVAAVEAGSLVFHGLLEPLDERMVELRSGGAAGHTGSEVQPTSDAGDDPRACRVITLATGPAVLATDAAASLHRALANCGATADWMATSWLGMLVRGAGREMSALRASSMTAAFERAVKSIESMAEAVVVDGGGGLTAPLLPTSTSGAINGSRAQFHVLCHAADPDDEDDVLTEAVIRATAAHRASGIRSTLAGIVLDASVLSESEAARTIAAGWSLGVPTVERHAELDPIAQHILSVARLRSTAPQTVANRSTDAS